LSFDRRSWSGRSLNRGTRPDRWKGSRGAGREEIAAQEEGFAMADSASSWPELEWESWKDTAETLHMMTQVVGKTRLELSPLRNHWWNVPLYLSARGLTTSAMPLPDGGELDIEFDFIADEVIFRSSRGQMESLPLKPQTIAGFFALYEQVLEKLGVTVKIYSLPSEVQNPIRFEQDTMHKSYDAAAVRRFWQALGRADTIFKRFSTNFVGKMSPVHFFWGSFDLAVTRFNGHKAPPRPGADRIQAEAYSHECISAGFWPGNGGYGRAAFYAYAAPVPAGLADCKLTCMGGFNKDLGEFLLDYDEVRRAADPEKEVLNFLNATYDAAATACKWDRASLERSAVL
jgi:hypothetical protein